MNIQRLSALSALGLAVLLCSACAASRASTAVSAARTDPGHAKRPPAVELAATPFFRQEDHFGGPAALAAVLARVDVRATPDQLASEIYLPGREGPLSADLAASVGHHGRIPQVLPAQFDVLLDSIAGGHPVLVLQNTGYAFLPHWQYGVVVGYDLGRDVLVLRAGARARQEIGRREFIDTWQRAGGFAMIVLSKGEAPVADVDFKGR